MLQVTASHRGRSIKEASCDVMDEFPPYHLVPKEFDAKLVGHYN